MKHAYLIDLDGTMYQGNSICPYAKEFILYLMEQEIPFVFFTNNSSRTPRQAKEHMERLGFVGIEDHHFFTSAMAAGNYIARTTTKRKAFMVGEEGLKQALLASGFELVEHDADFVFVGLHKEGNYALYSKALQELMKGAILVGTNNDRRILLEDGPHLGNGAIVALLEYASDTTSIKIGKPHPPMIEEALAYLGRTTQECILVGDNLETDIACGVNQGMKTIMVLGGIHNRADVDRLRIQPSRIINDLSELIEQD